MRKIFRYTFISIILFSVYTVWVKATIIDYVYNLYSYNDYEKSWNQELDRYIQEDRNIFIGTITDIHAESHKSHDAVSLTYDIQVHAYWWNKQTKLTKLVTVQKVESGDWEAFIRRFAKNKTHIFFNKSSKSIQWDDNIQLKEIGQGNSVKYFSKLWAPDYVYQSDEFLLLADAKTFQQTQDNSLGDYEDVNFIYKWNYITHVKNTDKLIKLWENIFRYEDKILLQKGKKYQFFTFVSNDFQFKELWNYYILQNNEKIYGISKWKEKQTISLIKNLWNINEMKHKFWNFYEDNNNVYFVTEIFQWLPLENYILGEILVREEWDFHILDNLYLDVNYTVIFDSISKELFNKVHSVYGQKIKKLSYEKKLWLLEKIWEIKNSYYKKRSSKNPKFVKKYKETEFILNYLISNLQIETKNREIKIQYHNDIKHLMWNVFEYEGKILIKKWDRYFYYYKMADDFKIKMVNGYVLIYNNSKLYSISQKSDKPIVLKIDYWYIVSGFDLDEFVHVEWKLYKDDTYYYIPNIIDALDTQVAKFWYDIWWINQEYNINTEYDYSTKLNNKNEIYMLSLFSLWEKDRYEYLTEKEIKQNIQSIRLEQKYIGRWWHIAFFNYFKLQGLEQQLQKLQDEK